MIRYFDTPPIVVGGVGGSGTRVVAAILRAAGVFIGSDLNGAKDNLRFAGEMPAIRDRLRAETAPTPYAGDAPPALTPDTAAWIGAILEGFEQDMRADCRADGAPAALWGWKLPAVFHLLGPLARHFGPLTYVHVVRHGVDMAFSSNQNQARDWGWRFGISAGDAVSPAESLRYWVRANRQALADAARFSVNLLVVNFDALCREPHAVIAPLMDRLGIAPASIETLEVLVRPPSSIGRRFAFDGSFVRPDDRTALRELGFEP